MSGYINSRIPGLKCGAIWGVPAAIEQRNLGGFEEQYRPTPSATDQPGQKSAQTLGHTDRLGAVLSGTGQAAFSASKTYAFQSEI